MITNLIQLDFNKENDLKVPSVQYDSGSRFVKIKLQRNKSPFEIDGYRVTVVANKVDGTEIMNDCTILDGVNGVVQFEITEQFNAVEGVVDCQLKLFKGKTLLTSMPFSINVVKSVSTKEIVSSNELKTLVNALGEVQDIDNRFAQTNAQLSQEIDVERKRIDNFNTLQEGSTTGDAELMDIRIGSDGNTYNNAGNAVREQVKTLQSEIEGSINMLSSNISMTNKPQSLFPFILEQFVDGYWLNKYTPEVYDGWGYTKNFIAVTPSTTLYFRKTETKDFHSKVVGASSIYITEYDLTGKFIKQVATANTFNCNHTLSDNCYFIRLSMSLADMKRGIRYYMGESDVTMITDFYRNGIYDDDKMLTKLAQFRFIQMLSPRVLVTSKTPIYIYPSNLLLDSKSLNPNFYLDDRLPLKQQKKRLWSEKGYVGYKEYQLSAITGVEPRSYYLYDDCYIKKMPLAIDSIDADTTGIGLLRKVMFIGDSITAEGTYVKQVHDLFATDVSNIELVGTLGGENNKHEGRGGWSAKKYCTTNEYNGSTNAFLNPLTNKFDFSYYMNSNSFDGVDIVFINLGINDLSENPYSDSDYLNIIRYYKEMINSIKSYNPNVKILCGLCILPANYEYNVSSLGQTDYSKKDRQLFIEKLQIGLNGLVDAFVPYFLCIDTENDFPTELRDIDAYNQDKVIYCTDITHPKRSGYMKLGDMSYNYIKHMM